MLTNSFSRALLRFNDYVFRDERLASTAFLVFLVYTFTLFTTRLSTFPLLGFDAHASAVFTVLLACSIGLKFHSPIFRSARSVMLVFPVLVLAPLDSRRIDKLFGPTLLYYDVNLPLFFEFLLRCCFSMIPSFTTTKPPIRFFLKFIFDTSPFLGLCYFLTPL